MKKNLWLALALSLVTLTGCGGVQASLTIANITMDIDETREVSYTLTPSGLFAATTLELVNATPSDIITINEMTIHAIDAGVATIKATATNMPGADKKFSASTNFTVTINPIVAPAGDYVRNGGFEYGLREWTFTPNQILETVATDNEPHTGTSVLNLWRDQDSDQISEAIDMTISQTISNVNAGNYLYSLWYQGTLTTLELEVTSGLTSIAKATLSGLNQRPVPDHQGYTNLGVALTLNTTSSISITLKVVGPSGYWGFIDDISFKLGTIDDLLKAPVGPQPDGNFLLNGGFENGLLDWTFSPQMTLETVATDNNPHSGEAVLNLWHDINADNASDDLDVTVTQTITDVPSGTYLLSLWYQGTTTSIDIRIKDGSTILVDDTLNGLDYRPVPEHLGYTNFGIEVTLSAVTTLTIEIHVSAVAGYWGFIDDVIFNLGTLDDLLVAPANPEEGYDNYIPNGNFGNNTSWTVTITGAASSKQANFASEKLRIWTNGVATLRISQTIELPAGTYQMCIYFNGGVFDGAEYKADVSYAYVKQGEILHTLDIAPVGWDDGNFTRVEKSNISLSGTVEVGIYINFIAGSNNWVDLDNFTLWTYNV